MITEEKAREMLKYYLEEWRKLSEIARISGDQKDWLNARETMGCYSTMKQVLEIDDEYDA